MSEFTNKDQGNKGILEPDQKAPDFTLNSTSDRAVSLQDFHGKPVILVFYPADFSPVCTDQLSLYNELLSEFNKYHAEILGISVDSVWAHKAFAKERNLHFPLLADFEPKGEVGRKYGAYDYQKGREERALFVIDPQGKIQWSYVSPSNINPGADGILSALDQMKEKQEAAHGQADQTH
jgi:peroxiredoxin